MQKIETTIRKIRRSEWDMAMQLAWDTFLVYEAPEYEKLGIRNFQNFVKGRELKQLFLLGEYDVYGAFLEDVIVGIIGMRKRNHISLLFVEPQYHHQGIASSLIEYAKVDVINNHFKHMTVHSSPYAVPFYHKLGFTDVDCEQKADGIRFTPMVLEI